MKIRYLILLFAFLALSKCTFSQWTFLNSNTVYPLKSVFFINDSTGYAVGGLSWSIGVILKTTNAGLSWETTYVSHFLNSIYFVTIDTGYAVGENGTILKTTNGGVSWLYQNSTLSVHSLSSVFFTTSNIGYVGAVNGSFPAFLKTIDGGQNWVNYSGTVGAWSVHFPSIHIGYAVGGGKIYKTNNDGLTWSSSLLPEMSYNSVFFLNDSVGFAVGMGGSGTPCYNYATIIKTVNRGASWVNKTIECSDLFSVYFPSNDTGYAVGIGFHSSIILKTNNSGTDWYFSTVDTLALFNKSLYSVFCTNPSTCYAVGDSGIILKTVNGGGPLQIVAEINFLENAIKIFPNPAINNLYIQGKQINEIQISNIIGQRLKEFTNLQKHDKLELNISDLKNGIYLISVITSKGNYNKKIFKE